jgi:predicted ATPase
MLSQMVVKSFKSRAKVEVTFPKLAVLFGPNAEGKSNLLDAVQALSRIATARTLSDALSEPVRGYPAEPFTFPEGALAALLSQISARFSLDADLNIGKDCYRYCITVEFQPRSGSLGVQDKYLAALTQRSKPKGHPSIERVGQ